MMPADHGSHRVILYRVEAKPQVISVSPDAAGGNAMAMKELLGGPVACVPLHDGIQLYCNRGGLLFGLALARRALALSPSRRALRSSSASRTRSSTSARRSGLPTGTSCWPGLAPAASCWT
jgi:hypothetical protein